MWMPALIALPLAYWKLWRAWHYVLGADGDFQALETLSLARLSVTTEMSIRMPLLASPVQSGVLWLLNRRRCND